MGKQVADNTELQLVAEIHKHKDGFYYVTNQPKNKRCIIRKEYIPIGKQLHYPKKWGRKEGSTILLKHRIGDLEKLLEDVVEELSGLKQALEEVQKWED